MIGRLRIVSVGALVLLCVPSGLLREVVAGAARPNIVVFYVDDMGWGSIGPNGQAARRAAGLPSVRTPNIDRLAVEGVNFSRGYGCTVCSPARSSLQTGYHQGHTFADRNDPDNAKKAIRADDPSIGKALRGAGYVTGYWGKWGYGGSKDLNNPVIENVQTLPTSHGYQYVVAELHHVRAHTYFQPTLWSAPAGDSDAVGGLELVPNSLVVWQKEPGQWPLRPALQQHPQYPQTAYCDDMYAFSALQFVRRQAQQYLQTGQPFHALLAVQIPHAPFGEITTLPEWDREYRNDGLFDNLSDQTRQWAAMVTRIDAHFGNILAALEDPNGDGDTADSVAAQTLVVFESDNGGPRGPNNVELDANGGLRGNKGSIQEGGIRVPLVMRWPAKIHATSMLKAGTHCERVVDVTDLLPTFCELAGARVPVGIDGVSIAPLLTGEGHQRQRDFVIHEASNGQSIIRGRYKLVHPKRGRPELYDLNSDPAEKNNLASNHPEMVAELSELLIGERVKEPKGFANTYHRWIGASGAPTSAAENWTDYHYTNAGKTYLSDTGAPRSSWTATVENSGMRPNVARVDRDLHLLGLDIRGNEQAKALQVVRLGAGVSLTGRNEIRVGRYGELQVAGGTVSSLRWLELEQDGCLSGHGTVSGHLYNGGVVKVSAAGNPVLIIRGDYFQDASGRLQLQTVANQGPLVTVTGAAHLDGRLVLNDLPPVRGNETVLVMRAGIVTGRFSNPDNWVTLAGGKNFQIEYSEQAVTLRAAATP